MKDNEPQYTNQCYQCGHSWLSWHDDEECPECGEMDGVGTDTIGDALEIIPTEEGE